MNWNYDINWILKALAPFLVNIIASGAKEGCFFSYLLKSKDDFVSFTFKFHFLFFNPVKLLYQENNAEEAIRKLQLKFELPLIQAVDQLSSHVSKHQCRFQDLRPPNSHSSSRHQCKFITPKFSFRNNSEPLYIFTLNLCLSNLFYFILWILAFSYC